jgi:hypothetical protein
MLLIYRLEKGVTAMLSQVHTTLDQGIRELLKTQSAQIEKSQNPELAKISQNLSLIMEQFQNSMTASTLDAYFSKSGSFQAQLSSIISAELQKTMSSLGGTDGSMVRRWSQQSLVMSPLESREIELKYDIDRDIETGQFEKAFTSALHSSDLSIVLVYF